MSTHVVAFCRVSTSIQDYERQSNELTVLANSKGWKLEAIIGLCTIMGVASCLYLCFEIMILDEPITKQSIAFLQFFCQPH